MANTQNLTEEQKRLLEKAMADFNGCPLFEGREKGDMSTLEGETVTIDSFFPLSDYHAVVFVEHPDKVFLSGGGLKKFLAEYEEIAIGRTIKILPMMKTQSKRDYRPINIVK